MGHWGTKPLENDDACDWVDSLIENHIRPALTGEDYDEIRASALILKAIERELNLHHRNMFILATTKLLKILNDKGWLSRWKDPKATRISILNQIYSLWIRR